MSTGQAPAQADLDLQQIINLLDTVLTSDDQRLKDMLRQLLVTTILITGENPADMIRVGPLNDLFNQQTSQSRRISNLEEQIRRLENAINNTYRGGGGGASPRWGDSFPNNPTNPWGGGSGYPTTTWSNPPSTWSGSSSSIDSIRELLKKDLE